MAKVNEKIIIKFDNKDMELLKEVSDLLKKLTVTKQLKDEISTLATELSNVSRFAAYNGELSEIVAKMRKISNG
jgi:hypothetical protein